MKIPGGEIEDREFWVEITDLDKSPAAYLQLYDAYIKEADPASALTALEDYLVLFPKDSQYKVAEETAKKLRASQKKAQFDAYRSAKQRPAGSAETSKADSCSCSQTSGLPGGTIRSNATAGKKRNPAYLEISVEWKSSAGSGSSCLRERAITSPTTKHSWEI